jgi:hypothetical protein
MRGRRRAIAAGLGALLLARSAGAFALIEPNADPALALSQAARWSPTSGQGDGIQVGIQTGLGSALATGGEDPALIEQAVLAGILAWESPALQFDVGFDANVVEGTESGLEMDLFAVGNDHPVFSGNSFFGAAIWQTTFLADRPLSNGQSSAGYAITGVDLYFNIDQQVFLAPLGALRIPILTRIVMHEVGHGIGLHHPNDDNPVEGTLDNFDTDFDPLNPMFIDPSDPLAGLMLSPNTDNTSIMSNTPCGPNPTAPCDALFFESPRPDDLGGRDFLYPVPEPTTSLLLVSGLLALAAKRRRESHAV